MAERILVVEDEQMIRELVAEVLQEEGYEVVVAANGSEALTSIDAVAPFDLIVLDMWMPVVNGWQFAEALEQRGGERPPILVMTAAREARERALEIGAAGFIGKPFDVDQFVRAVHRAIQPEGCGTVFRSVYASTVRAASVGSFARNVRDGLKVSLLAPEALYR